MKYILSTILFCLSLVSFGQDFRYNNWLDNKESIKKAEKGIFIEEYSKPNYVEEVHFVEFVDGFAYHYYYVLRKNQLIGVKSQRLRLSGENSKFNALEDYKEVHQNYLEKYGEESIKEKPSAEQAVNILEVRLADRELFVTVEKNGHEYYLIENVFRKN